MPILEKLLEKLNIDVNKYLLKPTKKEGKLSSAEAKEYIKHVVQSQKKCIKLISQTTTLSASFEEARFIPQNLQDITSKLVMEYHALEKELKLTKQHAYPITHAVLNQSIWTIPNPSNKPLNLNTTNIADIRPKK